MSRLTPRAGLVVMGIMWVVTAPFAIGCAMQQSTRTQKTIEHDPIKNATTKVER